MLVSTTVACAAKPALLMGRRSSIAFLSMLQLSGRAEIRPPVMRDVVVVTGELFLTGT